MKNIIQQTVGRRADHKKSARTIAWLLALALLALALPVRTAQAQNPQQGNTNTLAGTWRVVVPAVPGSLHYEMFTADGRSVEINNSPASLSVGIGAWTRLGPREFLATMYKELFRVVEDANGEHVFQYNGTAKIRRQIMLSVDGNEITGEHKVDVFDPDGNLVFDDPVGTFTGTRVIPERLPPPPQPQMLPPTVSAGGDVTVRVKGVPGATHQIQRGSKLDGNWQRLTNLVVPTSGVADFKDPAPPKPSGFYRVGSDADNE